MSTQTPTQEASSPSPIEVVEKLNDADRTEWLKTGKLPASPETEESAPPSSAKTAVEEESDEETPESSSGKTEEDSEEPKLSDKGQRRFKQLLSRIKELETEVQKSKATAKEEKIERASRPKLTDYRIIEDYEAAMDVWTQNEVEFKAQEKLAKNLADKEKADKDAAVEAANKEIEKQWRAKVTTSTKKHPDFLEIASKAPLVAGSVPDSFILDSEIGPELLYHFGANPEDLERINEMPAIKQSREMSRLELKLSESPVRRVSAAPRPASEVGARGTPVEDPAEAALANKDFEAYSREQNAKERRARAAR